MFSPKTVRFIFAYIAFTLFAFLAKELWIENGDAPNAIISLLIGISSAISIYRSNFVLPQQFTPLNKVGLWGKIWRATIAVLFIALGSLGTILAVIAIPEKTFSNQITAILITMGMVYIGVQILRSK